jgi:peptidoglycan/xylan/chitin deacetylase (PgdA/CDA1 family)
MGKKEFFLFLLLIATLLGAYLVGKGQFFPANLKFVTPQKLADTYPSPTPTPTPKPLTFSEMNSLYGPCVKLPTLMYHHIQDEEAAKQKNQQTLTVSTDYFKKQMQYLKESGYKTLYMSDLSTFFDENRPISGKNILITFDDGYDDFAVNAAPTLKEYGFNATVFIPTGLMDNPGYLSWETIRGLAGPGNILFANHTWSHKNVGLNLSEIKREIETGDFQLDEKGFNSPKVFAYPYGIESVDAENVLLSLGYKLAFTTRPGSILCKKMRFQLPRIRVGNSPLNNYGL